jgi:hypothetical protein
MSKAKEPESIRDRLHEARIPIRMLVGAVEHPAGLTLDALTQMQESLVDFAIDSVSGSGQYIGEEQPEAVIAAFLRLMEAVPMAAATLPLESHEPASASP